MKTVKQIADELGVSKTAVRKKIENLGLRSGLQKNGNQFAIDEAQEKLIKSAFSKKKMETGNLKTETENSETFQLVSSVVFRLEQENEQKNEQLKEKDRQINNKDQQIAQLQRQIIDLQEENRELSRKLLELSGKIGDSLQVIAKTQLADKMVEGRKIETKESSDLAGTEAPDKNKGFLSRLFRK